ncbi:uncharacterized protein LOC100909052 [Galendromus occidentalis]|uniref:Uncharacterized protein LOC100909052 n=1 Tax=Galendromus occidentalis TaxID=34638 RepID=A0AAJ6QN33_9ACAR|nr:uncharacterized protein LOC100909052 [Galendromus occidentalis]
MDKIPEKIGMKDRTWTQWKRFRQQLEIFLVATKKEAEVDRVKIAILLASGGEIVLDEFNTLFGDQNVVKFEGVVRKLGSNFQRGESENFLAYQFRTRVQKETEDFAKWLTDLGLLSKTCSYGDQEERMIRDQIIAGIQSNETRRELLKSAELNLDEAIAICASMEASRKQMNIFEGVSKTATSARATQGDDETEEACAVRWPRPNNSRQPPRKQTNGARNVRSCRSCGPSHYAGANGCPAIGRKCNYCGRMNHFASVCTKKKSSVTVDCVESGEEEIHLVFAAESAKSAQSLVHAEFQIEQSSKPKQKVRFLLDSGASCNIVPRVHVTNAKINRESKPTLRTYGNRALETIGTCSIAVTNFKTGSIHSMTCVVAEDLTPILGRTTAEEIGLIRFDYERVAKINETKTTKLVRDEVTDVEERFRAVFNGELGKFDGRVKLHLKENSRPVSNSSKM